MGTPDSANQTSHLVARALAHELANALAGIMGVSQLMSRRLGSDAPARAKADQIRKTVARSSALPAQLSALVVARPTRPVAIDLTHAASDAMELVQQTAGDSIAVSSQPDGRTCRALAVPERLTPTFLLLTLLARRALPGGGKVQLGAAEDGSGSAVLAMRCSGASASAPVPAEGSAEAERDLVSLALRRIAAEAGGRLVGRTVSDSEVVVEVHLPVAPTEGPGMPTGQEQS